MSLRYRLGLVLAAWSLAVGTARADEPAAPRGVTIAAPSSGEDLEARLRRLEDENRRLTDAQRTLEKRLTHLADHAEREVQKPLFGFGDRGFYLGTRDRGFELRLRGVIQADGRAYFGQTQPIADAFLIRRARPILSGTVGEVIDFYLLPDFGEGKLQLLDAYTNLRPWRWLQLRGGKFKTPFGLERLQQEQYLTFVERGISQNLVPDRDIGLSLHGDVGGDTFSYELGVYNGTPDGANVDGDTNDGKDLVGRLFVHPFVGLSRRAGRLGLGFGATWGKQKGNATSPGLPTFKTTGQQAFFSYLSDSKNPNDSVLGNGDRYRFSPQLYYYVGPFGLLGEYVYSAQNVTYAAHRATIANQAWQLAASFVLTLEPASYEGVIPKRPFNPRRGRFGAFELAARYGELWIDPAAFPTFADPKKSARSAQAWAVELNWYLIRVVKFALQFERTLFTAGAAKGNRDPENALLGRLQVAF